MYTNKFIGLAVGAVFAVSAFAANDASASVVVFSDNFENKKQGSVQNVQRLPGWVVGGGGSSVDYIKAGDFGLTCGGSSGYCIDLDGSTKSGGEIATAASFGPGTYTLSFEFSGHQRRWLSDAGDAMIVSLGDWSKKFRTQPDTGFHTHSITFTTTTDGQLSFSQLGMSYDYYGIILDNVTLTYISGGSSASTIGNNNNGPTAQVPEPATLALFGAGLAGIGLISRRRRKK